MRSGLHDAAHVAARALSADAEGEEEADEHERHAHARYEDVEEADDLLVGERRLHQRHAAHVAVHIGGRRWRRLGGGDKVGCVDGRHHLRLELVERHAHDGQAVAGRVARRRQLVAVEQEAVAARRCRGGGGGGGGERIDGHLGVEERLDIDVLVLADVVLQLLAVVAAYLFGLLGGRVAQRKGEQAERGQCERGALGGELLAAAAAAAV